MGIMAVLPITTFGNPVLRMKTAPVEKIDAGVEKLIEDMIETMYEAPGVGLAAPQVGVSRSVFIFDAQDGLGVRVCINPEMLETSGEYVYEEGCLSVPGYFWPITRPGFSHVRGIDLDGNPVEYSGTELMGRVLQHEYDHLQGILLLERLEPRVKKAALRDIRNKALGLSE